MVQSRAGRVKDDIDEGDQVNEIADAPAGIVGDTDKRG